MVCLLNASKLDRQRVAGRQGYLLHSLLTIIRNGSSIAVAQPSLLATKGSVKLRIFPLSNRYSGWFVAEFAPLVIGTEAAGSFIVLYMRRAREFTAPP